MAVYSCRPQICRKIRGHTTLPSTGPVAWTHRQLLLFHHLPTHTFQSQPLTLKKVIYTTNLSLSSGDPPTPHLYTLFFVQGHLLTYFEVISHVTVLFIYSASNNYQSSLYPKAWYIHGLDRKGKRNDCCQYFEGIGRPIHMAVVAQHVVHWISSHGA